MSIPSKNSVSTYTYFGPQSINKHNCSPIKTGVLFPIGHYEILLKISNIASLDVYIHIQLNKSNIRIEIISLIKAVLMADFTYENQMIL